MGQTLWFASRATGLVALVLLTMSLVLGIVGSNRVASVRWPRFALSGLHRNISLMTVLFLAVHASSAIIDPYAGIRWVDAVVPFVSSYHPFWLGLGAVALDLMLALIGTSLLRTRLSHRLWRTVHWAGYLVWPLAVVHGLVIGGKDSKLSWVISLNVTCALVVLVAVVWRLRSASHPDSEARRAATVGGR
ncbi:ferric reductase-like transmembrane domain-containing protein [Pseudonocardia acaciae]|uniref:ferric reductase-like transmembrane domain-containing protein n=1 Tax=Pseudonocardia acaciae TaxID=551276 RepID=UPI0004917B1A|nr:ferric reductase-like transmembrane domain-containing protein [Pseudonocardia acaciae]